MDTTNTRVARLIKEGYLAAHPEINERRAARAQNDPCCTCDHHASAHYGDMGEDNCGEPGCGCRKFEEAPDA